MRHAAYIQSVLVGSLFAVLMLSGNPADAASQFAAAKPHGKAGCPAGTFLDIGRGDCWSCPKDYNRTIFPVTANNACERPARTVFKRATRHGRGTGLLGTDCPRGSGQFWDPNGYCYSCQRGYNRTAFSVTSAKACSRGIRPAYAKATKKQDFCPKGTFLDIGRGDCWSCPADWYRTVNPVTGPKACANNVVGIFAADTSAMCTQVITALREGEKGVTRLMTDIEKLIGPVMKPVDDGIRQLNDQLKTPAELDKLLDNLANSLRPYSGVIDEVQRLSDQLDKTGDQLLRTVLLNPKLMCEGNLTQIDRQLTALGFRPRLRIGKSGLLDNALIGNAYAATKGGYAAFALSASGRPPNFIPITMALTYVSNFQGRSGLFYTVGSFAPPNKGLGVSLGGYIFPHADISDFEGLGVLSSELSLGAGDKLKAFFAKVGSGKRAIPDGINVTFDIGFTVVPGFGGSKDIVGTPPVLRIPSPSGTVPIPTPAQSIVSVSLDFSFKLR